MEDTEPNISPERWDERTRILLGDAACERLSDARVFVAGLGGVGGYAVEMLVRSGVGNLTLVDADNVAITNLNRQIIATHETLGLPKALAFAARCHEINPAANINCIHDFLTTDNIGEILSEDYDYVIDAIDTVAPKVALLLHCMDIRLPVISSMGAGGRIDPTKVGYFDLWETREDGLARAVRQRLKAKGRHRPLKVVASTEAPFRGSLLEVKERNKATSFGTLASIPALFGIYLANYVILKLTQGIREK